MKLVYKRGELLELRHECQTPELVACFAAFLSSPPAAAAARTPRQPDYASGAKWSPGPDQVASWSVPPRFVPRPPEAPPVYLSLADVPPGAQIFKAVSGAPLPENAVPIRVADEHYKYEWPPAYSHDAGHEPPWGAGFSYNYKYTPFFAPYIRKSSAAEAPDHGSWQATASSASSAPVQKPSRRECESRGCSSGSSDSNDVQIQLP